MTNMKTIIVLLLSFVILLSCKESKQVDYEVKDWLEANLILSCRKPFPLEHLKLKVNGKVVYEVVGDSTGYSLWKLFNIPFKIKTLDVISYYKGKKILNSSLVNTFNANRLQVRISLPYPKNMKYPPWPIKLEWLNLPMDSIKRHVILQPDTSKEMIIPN